MAVTPLQTPSAVQERPTNLRTVGSQPTVAAAAGVGVSPNPGIFVADYGDGVLRTTIVTLVNAKIATSDGTSNAAYVGQNIYRFPVGTVIIFGGSFDCTGFSTVGGATGINTGVAVKMAVGTVTQTAVGGTQATTVVNIVASTATTMTLFSGAAFNAAIATGASNLIVGTGSTSGNVFFNIGVATGSTTTTGADVVTVSGTIAFTWALLGKTGQ